MGIDYRIIVAIVLMVVGIVNQEFYRNNDNKSVVIDSHIIVIVVSIAICILIIIVFNYHILTIFDMDLVKCQIHWHTFIAKLYCHIIAKFYKQHYCYTANNNWLLTIVLPKFFH